MRFVGRLNLRVLFSFFQAGQKEIVILLNCFQEKENKKKNSAKSYTKAIEIAKARIKELVVELDLKPM